MPGRTVAALLSAAILAGCAPNVDVPDPEPRPDRAAAAGPAAAVNALADRYVAGYFEAFPHQATLAGAAGMPHDRLPDLSPAALSAWEATEDSILAALEAVDAGALGEDAPEAVTYAFLRDQLRNTRAWRACQMQLWNVSPTWTGWQQELALLASAQPMATAEQREAAVQRFAELPRYLRQETANLRDGLARGYSAPKGNVRSVVRQVDALLAAPVAESPFVAMAPEDAPAFRAQLEALERASIRPALLAYRDFLESEYLPSARDAVGVSEIPGGDACYRAAIRYHATVDVAPEEVHRIGLERMDTIRAEMSAISARSFGTSAVDEALEIVRKDPRYLFSGREEMRRVAEAAVARAEAAVPRWFGIVPDAEVVVEPVPAFSEASAPGGFYNPPAEDGTRPGMYSINLYEAAGKPRAGLEATAFHETWPGHHLQGTIAMGRAGLHPASRYFYLSGFGEGWALYSERLADEMDLYSGDVDRMGLLSNEALRAARLVVDAGMHALGWTRQQAIDYMLANTAESRSSVEAEVDRYIAVPGQATSYMLGALEIMRLRRMAEERLGGAFDIRAFHDRVLEDGAVPLMVLRRKIERWVEAEAR